MYEHAYLNSQNMKDLKWMNLIVCISYWGKVNKSLPKYKQNKIWIQFSKVY